MRRTRISIVLLLTIFFPKKSENEEDEG